MCFHLSNKASLNDQKKRFKATRELEGTAATFAPVFHVSGFSFPLLPVVANDQPEAIQFLRWGLVPSWAKTEADALEIRTKTLNARAETLFEKPSFREAAGSRRALILADGFFEWKETATGKQPYFIRLKSGEPFALGGIWEVWTNPKSGEQWRTFSIVTTEANDLMREIHNTKFRMPLILPADVERDWLSPSLSQSDVQALAQPLRGSTLEAYPVSNLIGRRGVDTNTPKAQERNDPPAQTALF